MASPCAVLLSASLPPTLTGASQPAQHGGPEATLLRTHSDDEPLREVSQQVDASNHATEISTYADTGHSRAQAPPFVSPGNGLYTLDIHIVSGKSLRCSDESHIPYVFNSLWFAMRNYRLMLTLLAS